SHHSRPEAVDAFGIPEERIAVVTPDVDPQFRHIAIGHDAERALCERHKLRKQFVMYTGGIDHRKNVDGLVSAFARLPSHIRTAYQLAIVCSASEAARMQISQLAAKAGLNDSDVIMTGFVNDDDLVGLYNLCELFVFPSLYEGFGLPVLEA